MRFLADGSALKARPIGSEPKSRHAQASPAFCIGPLHGIALETLSNPREARGAARHLSTHALPPVRPRYPARLGALSITRYLHSGVTACP
ncbi:hypothetical protein XACJK48_7630003 [Xanthomonas citri pv. citri]|nr:hypothetical protein XACJK2_1460052 [Xanthomonas citri pv. citri]CEH54441.1 hypothetical protein XACJK48_7630003 [Xanthomonas citri pv. citri]